MFLLHRVHMCTIGFKRRDALVGGRDRALAERIDLRTSTPHAAASSRAAGGGDALPAPQGSLAALLEAVSIINLSFLCHFNCLPIFHSLPGAPSAPASSFVASASEKHVSSA